MTLPCLVFKLSIQILLKAILIKPEQNKKTRTKTSNTKILLQPVLAIAKKDVILLLIIAGTVCLHMWSVVVTVLKSLNFCRQNSSMREPGGENTQNVQSSRQVWRQLNDDNHLHFASSLGSSSILAARIERNEDLQEHGAATCERNESDLVRRI